MIRFLTWVVSALIGLVVLAIIGSYSHPPRPAVEPLFGSVSANALTLHVENQDNQEWYNVRVRVNEKYDCPPIDLISPAQTGTVALFGCTTRDGDRFQTSSTKVVEAAVTARLQKSSAAGVGTYTFPR